MGVPYRRVLLVLLDRRAGRRGAAPMKERWPPLSTGCAARSAIITSAIAQADAVTMVAGESIAAAAHRAGQQFDAARRHAHYFSPVWPEASLLSVVLPE